MKDKKIYRAIGLMSGTSLDGVDAALIETDGGEMVYPRAFLCLPYETGLREKIRRCLGRPERVAEIEKALTQKHIEAVRALAAQAKMPLEDVEVIGFHGQTVYHNPAQKMTVQLGDARVMAHETGVQTVADFRQADIKAGGQGAPLMPLYHRARVRADNISLPVAVLNIGGVANVTWIGEGDDILAFDTGPGNALIDDWILEKTGKNFDEDGKLAAAGVIDKKILEKLLSHSYFAGGPPKSLDRNHWDVKGLKKLSVEDGAATLGAFTAGAVKKALEWLPSKPRQWLVAGGGRKNEFIMEHLRIALSAPVNPVEAVGWNGDALEAEGFAYLAVRSLLGEPLSLPTTTGAPRPLTGGVLYKA